MEDSLKGDGFIAGAAELLKVEVAPEGTIDDQMSARRSDLLKRPCVGMIEYHQCIASLRARHAIEGRTRNLDSWAKSQSECRNRKSFKCFQTFITWIIP